MLFNYSTDNTDVNDILHSAQLLVDAFAKTVEENNCLNILPITLHQNIVNGAKDVQDIVNAVNSTQTTPSTGTTGSQILDSVAESVKQHKNSCFNCKLAMPDIGFSFDPSVAINKLKAYLNLYKSSLNKLDLCQVGFSLQSNCLPDIIKLIVIILTAYLTIMNLKILSNFSVSVFIKGVISKLFSLLIGSFKISINIGATNISCLINALKEIALSVPTAETVSNQLNAQQKEQLGLSEVKNKTVSNFNKGLDNAGKSVDSTIKDTVDNINKSFDVITNTVDFSLASIKEHIESLLGLKDIMQGEDVRLGIDITSLFKSVNNMIQVLNMLSAIALSLAKQAERDKMCKTNNTTNSLSDSTINDTFNKDVVQEYNKKVTDVVKSDNKVLSLLIHDKPVTDGLPKIDLYDCSIDDFIEAHTLPNIVQVAQRQVNNELNGTQDGDITGANSSGTYNMLKPDNNTTDLIKNLVELIYVDPVTEDPNNPGTNIKEDDKTPITSNTDSIINPLSFNNITESLQDLINNRDTNDNTLKCKSVDDVLDILNSIKR